MENEVIHFLSLVLSNVHSSSLHCSVNLSLRTGKTKCPTAIKHKILFIVKISWLQHKEILFTHNITFGYEIDFSRTRKGDNV